MTPQEINSVREKLSKAYLYAMIAKLNYGAQEYGKDFDGCGYDFGIVNHSLGEKRTVTSVMNEIKIQLKGVSLSSTSMISQTSENIRYRLSSDLPKWGPKCFLVILTIPEVDNLEEWIVLDEEQLVLKKCAYFLEIPDSGLQAGYVEIPKTNLLTIENFKSFFESITKDDF